MKQDHALTIIFGGCFVLALLAGTQAQIGPPKAGTPGGSTTQVQFNDAGSFGGDANILINKTNHTLAFGGITASFGAISGPCTQALATNRVCLRLADDSNWANAATIGVDVMAAANRKGFIDGGGSGLRISADTGTGIDLLATASGGGGSNGVHFSGAHNDTNYSFQTPSTGFSVTLANNIWHTVLDPAGTLATGTVILPALPGDGMIVNVRSSQVITALTVSPNSGQSVLGNPTAFAAGGIFECIYHLGNTTWYC